LDIYNWKMMTEWSRYNINKNFFLWFKIFQHGGSFIVTLNCSVNQFVFLGLAAVFFAVLAVPAIFFAKFLQKLWSTRARNCTLGTIRAVLAGICREKRFFVFVKKNRRPTVILMLNHEALAHLMSSGILYLLLLELGLPISHHIQNLLTSLHLLQLLWHHLETRRGNGIFVMLQHYGLTFCLHCVYSWPDWRHASAGVAVTVPSPITTATIRHE